MFFYLLALIICLQTPSVLAMSQSQEVLVVETIENAVVLVNNTAATETNPGTYRFTDFSRNSETITITIRKDGFKQSVKSYVLSGLRQTDEGYLLTIIPEQTESGNSVLGFLSSYASVISGGLLISLIIAGVLVYFKRKRPVPVPDELLEGDVVTVNNKEFTICRFIKKGGVAKIYDINDEHGSYFILKLMSFYLDDEDMVKKFIGEGFIINRINQTQPDAPVVHVHDYGKLKHEHLENERPFIIMEKLEGEELAHFIFNQSLSLDQKIGISINICKALEAAHKADVVHRDITPSNIIVTNLQENEIGLIDFGVAKHDQTEWLQDNNTGTYGKYAYMSPEQHDGEDITYKSDYYSLGILMYELFCDKRPFDSPNELELSMQHKFEDLPDFPDTVPPVVQGIIEMLLEKEPANRPDTLKQTKESLKSILS